MTGSFTNTFIVPAAVQTDTTTFTITLTAPAPGPSPSPSPTPGPTPSPTPSSSCSSMLYVLPTYVNNKRKYDDDALEVK